jgi:aryl-alcohol dehydrogenase-like predicted oxidoreductase
MKPLAGRATGEGTARFAGRLGLHSQSPAEGHFRALGGLRISSVGFGLAAGDPTDEVDARYRAAIAAAVQAGCNHFDAAISYRGQRSEVSLGQAIAELVSSGLVKRDEIIVASKAGFIPYPSDGGEAAQYVYEHFIAPGIAEPDDFAGGIHCMAPNFLSQQIAWSLRNLGLRTIEIYYLQNPETQLSFVDRTTFRRRVQLAFARLEEEVSAGRIGCYGLATWEGLRVSPLSDNFMSLEVARRLVTEVAGANHHLRVVQLPLSAVMPEAVTLRNQPVRNSMMPVLSAAADLGFAVVASAALGQGQISPRMQEAMHEVFGSLGGAGQRSLQFVRSLPGVVSALFGSTHPEHVRENLAVLAQPPNSQAALRLAHMSGR